MADQLLAAGLFDVGGRWIAITGAGNCLRPKFYKFIEWTMMVC